MRDRGDAAAARALADDLSESLAELSFPSPEERARFFHNVGVFFGTPGPAADLSRARACFDVALGHFTAPEETGWHARVLHNFGSALSNLATSPDELAESVSLFERALEWRTAQREIARGVTLHNMGLALRRWAEFVPARSIELLERSAAALSDAIEIRSRHGLAEGRALSLFHLGLTLEALSRVEEAREAYRQAASEFDRLGKSDSAAIARSRLIR